MEEKGPLNTMKLQYPRRTAILVAGLAAFAAILSSQNRAAGQITVDGRTMGPIRYHVTLSQYPSELDEAAVGDLVQGALDQVDALMSTYRDDSDVSRFNQSSSTDWVPVAAETAQVVARALEFSRLSGGAFDITVAPLVNLWNFGPNPGDRTRLPDPQAVADALSRIGYQKLDVRLDPPALKKDEPRLWIDLSAIAEGYAVDRVASALADAGVDAYLVEVGGEVRAAGKKSDGRDWHVGIIWPSAQEETYREIARLADRSLATSGDYRNFTEIDGIRYCHAIDPKTGFPVRNSMAGASVIAPDCMTADAMATTVMVLGADRGHALCSQLGLPLLTYEHDGAGFRNRTSGEFPLASPPSDESLGSGWIVFLSAAAIFGLALLAMAIGAIFGNRQIAGSCGGLANVRDEGGNIKCGLCTRPSEDCQDVKRWLAKEAGRPDPVSDEHQRDR
jgi:thiamine biosynthesis lipoprotein